MIKDIFTHGLCTYSLDEAISYKSINNFLVREMLNVGTIKMLYMSEKEYMFMLDKMTFKLIIFGKGFTLEDMKSHKYITRKFYGDNNNSKSFINQLMLDLYAFKNGQVKTSIIDGKTKLFPR